MNRILVAVVALLALVGVSASSWLLASSTAYDLGFAEGQAAADKQCLSANLDALQGLIDSTSSLTTAASTASQKLEKTISARQQADAKTTREIRNALAATASNRTSCVFDDGVMQQLATARDRAAEAAASGIGRVVPAADRGNEQQR